LPHGAFLVIDPYSGVIVRHEKYPRTYGRLA
jgi:hypothetical protein